MRDPNRIEEVLREVRRIWEIYPDMRLGQLLCNLADWAGCHVWDVEDESVIEEVSRHCDHIKQTAGVAEQ